MGKKIVVSLLATFVLASVHPAEAQQPKNIARIGYVFGSTPAATAHNIEAFRQGLRELGYLEGKTFVSALSVSGAILLILEMYTPYSGVITVSSAPLRVALAHLGQ